MKKHQYYHDKEEEVPIHLRVPSIAELEKLCVKNNQGDEETIKEKEAWIQAFTFMVENILPGIRGSSNWKEDICSMPVSETNATPSDMAFGALIYETILDKWKKIAQGTEVSKTEKGKYTSSGSNQKYSGWSLQGLNRYGELYHKAIHNGIQRYAKDVEKEVMMSLKVRHYSAVTVEMIQESNTKKRK